jgi:D-amino-acid oxidase
MSTSRIIVAGCGVAGLSSAIRLIEAGREVEIWTRDLPPRTTSSIAAAIWYPYAVGTDERVVGWSRASYLEFQRLAAVAGSGVEMVRGIELLSDGVHDKNGPHRAVIAGARELRRDELPARSARGFELELPVVEMPIYLDYLLHRFTALGGRVVERVLASLEEALADAQVVVNCTGLGSRELAHDGGLIAVRGQIVRVERGAIERFTLDDYDPRGVTYVVPRSRDCVLGGTREERREDLVPDESATAAILGRCAELEPRLRDARVLSVAVGLRPGRATVRLERETLTSGRKIVHNYGHGGAGVTLSWGCANEVLALSR